MKEIYIEVIELKKTFKCLLEFKNNQYVVSYEPLRLMSWDEKEHEAVTKMQDLLYEEYSFEDNWEDFNMGTPKFRDY